MREIKFRAWDKDAEKMILPEECDDEYDIIISCGKQPELVYIEDCTRCDAEFMEFTGLHDKNGVPIYEGDILETVCDGVLNPNYVVIWDDDELGFKATNGKEHYKTNYEYLGCCEEIVVIGNIYENPELLNMR